MDRRSIRHRNMSVLDPNFVGEAEIAAPPGVTPALVSTNCGEPPDGPTGVNRRTHEEEPGRRGAGTRWPFLDRSTPQPTQRVYVKNVGGSGFLPFFAVLSD